MTFSKLEKNIKELISKDEYELAVKSMQAYLKDQGKEINQLILQSGRYNSLKNDHIKGVINYSTLQEQLNQLRANLLAILDSEREKSLNAKASKKARNAPIKEYQLSFVRIFVLKTLLTLEPNENGLQIGEIHKLSNIQNRKFIPDVLYDFKENRLVEQEVISQKTFWKLTEKGRHFIVNHLNWLK